jgi:hypothetical protein
MDSLQLDPRQVRTFVQIAIDAGKSKVVNVIGSAVNLWNDVFDVKRPAGNHPDASDNLASVLGALANVGSGLCSDHLGL